MDEKRRAVTSHVSLVLRAGDMVDREYRREEVERMEKRTGNPIVPAIPIAVLIDYGTVSGGELTAAP